MKKLVTILAVVAMMALGTTAFAAGTATVNVSATVVGACSIATVADMTFGALPLVPALSTATATVAVNCPNTLAYTMNAGPGTFSLVLGANAIPGTYTPNGIMAGVGSGVDQNYTFTGTIAAAAYNGLPVGVYNGSFLVDVTP